MLQQVEYDPFKLLQWLKKVPNILTLKKRGRLILTKASKALLVLIISSQILLLVTVIVLISFDLLLFAALLFVALPLIMIFELVVISLMGNTLLRIKRAPLINQAGHFFENHQGVRIAVIGSYGKTSMKELLNKVLSSCLKVEMTPGNKNVAISHARWSRTLEGDEDVLIIEYGEGEPGDIKLLADLSHPTHAVVTGLAPNHLDQYKTIDALKADFWEISNHAEPINTYVNDDKTGLVEGFSSDVHVYNESGIDDWKVTDIKLSIMGTSFTLSNNNQKLRIKSGLLGRHNIGPLCAVAIIALDMGLSPQQVEQAISLTKAFEHRMQPYKLGPAWVIDDAYNGNLEGFKSGLKLLAELEAKRKIYVTPGLVDQGEETIRVHQEIGKAIAGSKPDKVVLMQNSVTEIIKESALETGYNGEIEIINNPLEYYSNLEHFLAAGDLVMLQNDWTDNYN